MMDLEFTFEEKTWEAALAAWDSDSIPAVQLLALLEGADEADLEDAFALLEERKIALDISQLPAPAADGEAVRRLRKEQQLVRSGDLLRDLEELDPLRLYLEELAAIPAAGDPAVLARRCAAGDAAAASQLTNLSLSRVVTLAQEYTGHGVLLLDLIQEGSLGLMQAIANCTSGDFETHRDWWIRQYLAKAVTLQARAGGMGQKLRQGMEDYRDVDQRLLSELGRNPTLEEIAEGMHVEPEEAAMYASMLAAAKSRQQVHAAQEPPEETEEDTMAVEDTAYFQSRQRILEMLSTLTSRETELITLRFGLEGGLPLTPEETGKKLGLTAKEVVTMEAEALAKLRMGN